MTNLTIPICQSEALLDGGKGIRFLVTAGGEDATAFVVRYAGVVHGYLNRCAHIPLELDWNPGEFFEPGGDYLMCSTHGALYAPNTGACAGGPCRGGSLRAINVQEDETHVYWLPDDYVRPAIA